MALSEVLLDVWRSVLVEDRPEAIVQGSAVPVQRTRAQGLRFVEFELGGKRIVGIEQNPNKASRWAKLAQQGSRIMQFSCQHRYFANVCDGQLTRYGAWAGLGLAD